MFASITLMAGFLGAVSAGRCSRPDSPTCQAFMNTGGVMPNLTVAANNSEFHTWRPKFHAQAPNSWQNDPVSLYYDETRGMYHVGYQYHHAHVNWGNISDAHAFSPDLVHYYDIGDPYNPLMLGPSTEYDSKGVFSGGAIENGYMGYITSMYTSVTNATNWAQANNSGVESQSLAYTPDNGVTWIKVDEYNPVIPREPDGWNITGWRDPLLFRDPALAAILGDDPEQVYCPIAGGIQQVGPRLSLYKADNSDLTSWSWMGPFLYPEANSTWNEKWSGSWGVNFEMGGLFTLQDESNQTHFFSTFGTQGGREPGNGNYALFATGSMSKSSNGSAIMDISAVGIVDNGNSYAQNSFWDTKESRRVMMAWTPEDLNSYGILAQGWQGALVLPRELFVKTITGVTNPASEVEEKAAWTYEKESNGSYTLKTLGQKPISELVSLRNTSVCSTIPPQAVCAVADFVDDGFGYKSLYNASTKNYEMQLSIDFSKDPSAAAGVVLRKSQSGFCEYTSIWYDAAEEYLYVDRDQSSIYSPYITNTTIQTKFRLWEIKGEREQLNLRIFVDNSILEIFANDVLALTTRIYPYLEDSNEIGLMVKNGSAQYSDVTVWDGLDNAWPERPYDTSVPLVWDGPEITDNGRLWVGN